MRRCPVTGEPLSGVDTVSRSAVARLVSVVSDLPVVMDTAAYALTGLRAGVSSGGSSFGSKPPLSLALFGEVDEMRDAVDAWAFALLQYVCPSARYVCGDWVRARAIFRECAPRARQWDEAPMMVDEVVYAVDRISRLSDRRWVDTVFAGPCPECGTDVLVRPGLAQARCSSCGGSIDVGEARSQMLVRLEWKALPREKARRAAEVVCGHQISPSTVRSWIRRGKLMEQVSSAGQVLVSVRDVVALASHRAG